MAFAHGVRRLSGGRLRVRLGAAERDLLRSLPSQLRVVLRAGHRGEGPHHRRLFPPAYDDAMAEAEYRELIGETVLTERLAALDDFAATLESGSVTPLGWTVELEPEQAAAWLSAVNDARLVLAAVVELDSEDRWGEGPDRDDPNSVALYYLSWLQEELLAALAGDL